MGSRIALRRHFFQAHFGRTETSAGHRVYKGRTNPETPAVEPILRPPAGPETIRLAKRLIRLARTGALGTLARMGGFPLTTLVGVASDDDGAPLLFLSGLAEHTKNIAADPRASLLFAPPAERGDPLNAPRISLIGRLAPADTPRRRQRYVQRNPKSTMTMALPDFRVHRLEVEAVHFNGGFGRADVVQPGDLVTAFDETLIAEEAALLAEAAALDPALLARAANALEGPPPRVAGLDADGIDLSRRGEPLRVDWDEAARTPGEWRARLAGLA